MILPEIGAVESLVTSGGTVSLVSGASNHLVDCPCMVTNAFGKGMSPNGQGKSKTIVTEIFNHEVLKRDLFSILKDLIFVAINKVKRLDVVLEW